MKLREEEFYEQYHQHGGTTIIPTEIFNELYDDATEEIERLNNIINEYDKWLESEIQRLEKFQNPKRGVKPYGQEYNNITFLIGAYDNALDKLQELKGVDKE